jgi:hypothetical protein
MEKMGIGNTLDKKVREMTEEWRILSRTCVDIQRQNMKVNMREKRLSMYHAVKWDWQNEDYKEICTREERKGIMWWKVGCMEVEGDFNKVTNWSRVLLDSCLVRQEIAHLSWNLNFHYHVHRNLPVQDPM